MTLTNPVAVMFWMAISLALAVGIYEAVRDALRMHRSCIAPTRTFVEARDGRVFLVMRGPRFSSASIEYTPDAAEKAGRALASMAKYAREQSPT